jgi:hypothetical protein
MFQIEHELRNASAWCRKFAGFTSRKNPNVAISGLLNETWPSFRAFLLCMSSYGVAGILDLDRSDIVISDCRQTSVAIFSPLLSAELVPLEFASDDLVLGGCHEHNFIRYPDQTWAFSQDPPVEPGPVQH